VFNGTFSENKDFFLHRSAMVNLSVNVFGENLNLLEIGGRAEGFEQLVKFSRRPIDTMLTFRHLEN
jgi:hypothetical protein